MPIDLDAIITRVTSATRRTTRYALFYGALVDLGWTRRSGGVEITLSGGTTGELNPLGKRVVWVEIKGQPVIRAETGPPHPLRLLPWWGDTVAVVLYSENGSPEQMAAKLDAAVRAWAQRSSA